MQNYIKQIKYNTYFNNNYYYFVLHLWKNLFFHPDLVVKTLTSSDWPGYGNQLNLDLLFFRKNQSTNGVKSNYGYHSYPFNFKWNNKEKYTKYFRFAYFKYYAPNWEIIQVFCCLPSNWIESAKNGRCSEYKQFRDKLIGDWSKHIWGTVD